MADFKRIEDQRYLNTLFGSLSRQKEIPISVLHNNRQIVARLTTDSINKQKIIVFPSEILPVTTGEFVKISFFYKEIFFIFETEVIETGETSFRIHLPTSILASYRRLVERYKPKNHQEALLGIQGYNIPLNLVDVSTKGLAFRAGERFWEEGQTVRNITIRFTNDQIVRLDGIIKHITHTEDGEFMYGIEIISIERNDFRELFTHIFERTYPYFSVLEAFSGEQVYKLYEQARFSNLKPRDEADDNFAELVENLEQVKDKSLIASSLVYQKSGKLIALGSVLRIYNRTFLGKPLAMLPQVRLNPKNKTNIYIGLADYLLNHPYFEYYLSYIDTDYEWHQDILTSAARIIGDQNKFCFEDAVYFESLPSVAEGGITGYSRTSMEKYSCETLDKPDPAFYLYCRDNMLPLEIECFGYTENTFKLDELSQIYQAYGFFLTRKLWRIRKAQDIVAYAVVECFSDPLTKYSHLDSCKVYLIDQLSDVAEIVNSIRVEMDLFYGFYGKVNYQLIIQSKFPTESLSIVGFTYKGRMGLVMANREGLSEYKQLLLANFEYHSKYYPLTHPQTGIWYLTQMYPKTSIANIAGTVRFKEAVDYGLLEKAVNLFISKNDGMRLRVIEENGLPRQYESNFEDFKPEFIDFSSREITEYYQWETEMTSIPFNLKNSDLFYFALIKIGDNDGGFYVNIHHIISDAWTMGLLVNQIVETYDALKKGKEFNLKEKNPSYFDYILKEEEYRYSEKFDEDRKFWNDKYATIPELMNLKPRKVNLVDPKTTRKTITLEKGLAQNIRNFCNETKTSPFTLFLSVLAIYLNRVTLKKDMVIGIPILNRSNVKEKETTGMFISTAPFRLYLNTELEFASFIQQVVKEWMVILKHQKYPYELTLKEFRERHKIAENLFDIILSYQNTKFEKEYSTKFISRWHFNGFQQESLNVHISDRDDEGVYIVNFDYLDEFFTADQIDCINEYFTNILKDAVENPTKKLMELTILSQEDKHKLLYHFNNTTAQYPESETLIDLFEEQVDRTPANIAVVYDRQQLTFYELNIKANQLARHLREKGVQADSIIGLMTGRSLEMMIGIIGILKAGAAYLPIDPNYPEDRIKFMLEDSNAKVLLSQNHFINKYNIGLETIDLDNITSYNTESSNLQKINRPTDLAYVLYTSGSTGNPKGVMIEHRSVVNLVFGLHKNVYSKYEETLNIALVAPYVFDASVQHLFAAPLFGHVLYITPEDVRVDGRKLIAFFNENRIDISDGTPMHLSLILHAALGMEIDLIVRHFLIGGDALPYNTVKEFYQKIRGSELTITNVYGPTECCVDATYYHIDRNNLPDADIIPIGAPLPNVRTYILDQSLNIVPPGIAGELFISGIGLARGYLGRPELTTDKFMNNPFQPGERMYRTGDLARWLPNGNIEFLGRMDNQVKIRGFRIELGEIENCLLKHDAIKEAVVMPKEDLNSMKYLSAYIVGSRKFTVSELREHLLSDLPGYMIPTHFIQLEKLPLTLNGKIDKNALLSTGTIIEKKAVIVQPRNETEIIIRKICQEVLNINEIGVTDNLMEVGADSLSFMRLQTMMFSRGWHLSFQDFYQYPTIADLAGKIEGTIQKVSNRQINQNDTAVIHNITSQERFVKNNEQNSCGNNVLLTGATGFLGIHILNELIISTQANIFCLIRGKDESCVKNRLSEQMNFYFANKHQGIIDKRVFVINGDLNLDQFGLTAARYRQLGERIDLIFHAAALVKHYGNYPDFKRVNVEGTKRLIDFASHYQIKMNHISTISILKYNKNAASSKCYFSENDFYVGQQLIDHVYIRSKYEAEKEILKAIENGLDATIYRVGNLTERYADGKFQINSRENMFHSIIGCIMEIGLVPEFLLEMDLEFTPVDLCSRAIVKIALETDKKSLVYHIFNHNYLKLKDYFNLIKDCNAGVQKVSCSLEEYIKLVLQQKNKPDALNFLVEYLKQYASNNQENVGVVSNITREYLYKLGFQWPEINIDYILKTKKSFDSLYSSVI